MRRTAENHNEEPGHNEPRRHELRRPIAIYYEHPDWFRPLFQRLDESGVAWKKIDAPNHQYGAGSAEEEFSLLFNRMSPSAWQRGLGHCIFYTLNYLAQLAANGVGVVNGHRGFGDKISKAQQFTSMEKLGLRSEEHTSELQSLRHLVCRL